MLWVQIPALYTRWTFFTYICCKNCNDVCLKRPKINEKEAGVGPLKKEVTATTLGPLSFARDLPWYGGTKISF